MLQSHIYLWNRITALSLSSLLSSFWSCSSLLPGKSFSSPLLLVVGPALGFCTALNISQQDAWPRQFDVLYAPAQSFHSGACFMPSFVCFSPSKECLGITMVMKVLMFTRLCLSYVMDTEQMRSGGQQQ